MKQWPSLTWIDLVSLFVGLWLSPAQPVHAQTVRPPALTPRVVVHDQLLFTDQVTVAEVVTPQAGWLVIHRSQDGNLAAVIGLVPVHKGVNYNVTVPILRALATPTLYVLLHSDAGQSGVYEFPGPDAPLIVSNPPMLVFQLTGLLRPSSALAPVGPAQTPPPEQQLGLTESFWLPTRMPAPRLPSPGAQSAVFQGGADATHVPTATIQPNGTGTVTLVLPAPLLLAGVDIVTTIPTQEVQGPTTTAVFQLYLPLIAQQFTQPGFVAQAANLRAGPGLNFPVVGRLPAREQVRIAACNAPCTWYQLASGLWIAAFLVQAEPPSPLLPRLPAP